MKRTVPFAIALAILLALLGFTLIPSRREENGPLVLGAASLQESLEAAADAWVAKGHARPVLSFAGTPALARQIEAGAPADIFISADEHWMDELARRNLIRHRSRASFLGNRLVLVEQAGKQTRIDLQPGPALAGALKATSLAMADPESVPAGRYARQALVNLKVWSGISGRIVRTENVRLAAVLVGRGEAGLGIVYETDALADPRLRIVAGFPESSHVPITYPLALLSASASPDAEGFRRFLLSEEAGTIFRRYGFSTGKRR